MRQAVFGSQKHAHIINYSLSAPEGGLSCERCFGSVCALFDHPLVQAKWQACKAAASLVSSVQNNADSSAHSRQETTAKFAPLQEEEKHDHEVEPDSRHSEQEQDKNTDSETVEEASPKVDRKRKLPDVYYDLEAIRAALVAIRADADRESERFGRFHLEGAKLHAPCLLHKFISDSFKVSRSNLPLRLLYMSNKENKFEFVPKVRVSDFMGGVKSWAESENFYNVGDVVTPWPQLVWLTL
jgi:hypothetical protein